jgi:polygalacturonase
MKIKSIYLVMPFLFFVITSCTSTARNSDAAGWEQADEITRNITAPSFPDKDFNVTSYGAKGDGNTDCTDAFRKAIEECSLSGGGRVVVPEGEYLTGAIHLKSNVNLYISENAVVKFYTDPSYYLPLVFTRWEGVECMNYSPLIYAFNEENIAVTGKGILDGQGGNDNWWNWKGNKEDGWKKGMPDQKAARKKLFEMAENNVPPEERIFGEGSYLRPNFIQPYRSRNILIEGVTFRNSPMWFLNPVLCENVTVKDVRFEGLGPNNDGCNPESSRNVLITGCYFDTGDDCIAIKSGRNADGRRINTASENIVIRNCVMKEGHGGVVIGSEISGSVRNVFAENCVMSSPNLDRALRIKTNSVRGGTVENVYLRNIEVGEVSEAVIKINFYYEEGDAGEYTPSVRNINVENLTSRKSPYALWIKAYDRSPAEVIKLENCSFSNVENESILENVEGLSLIEVKLNGKDISSDKVPAAK